MVVVVVDVVGAVPELLANVCIRKNSAYILAVSALFTPPTTTAGAAGGTELLLLLILLFPTPFLPCPPPLFCWEYPPPPAVPVPVAIPVP